MKKVLVIGHIWPYHPGAGARLSGLVRYLPESGWEPVVITKTLTEAVNLGCRIVETTSPNILTPWLRLFRLNPSVSLREQVTQRLGVKSAKSVKKTILYFFIRRFREIIEYPDLERGWKSSAFKAGRELIQNEGIEAIISTSPPVTSHLVARELKNTYGIPWLADFPHLWSQNNSYPYGPLRKLADRQLELKILKQANALVTTSEPFATRLRKLHKNKPVYAITHGFDPTRLNTPPAPLTRKFTITFPGTLDPKLREPSKLLMALRTLVSRGEVDPNEIEVRFYGPKEDWLQAQIEQYGLSDIVRQYAPVPVNVAWEREIESQILLILKWEDPREPGIHSLKIFEYLAARRPILAVGGYPDVVDELLDETKAGITAPTVEDIEKVLKDFYQEYRANGKISYKGNEAAISRYSHREMARNFSEILNQLVSERR